MLQKNNHAIAKLISDLRTATVFVKKKGQQFKSQLF